jgi:hypothetical protein
MPACHAPDAPLMQTQGIFKDSNPAHIPDTSPRFPGPQDTCPNRRYDAMLMIVEEVRLQESGHESSNTNDGASNSAHGSGSTSGLGSCGSSSGSARVTTGGARLRSGAGRGRTTSAGTVTRWLDSNCAKNNRGGVVCAHNDGLGAVHASSALNGDSLYTGRDSRDRSNNADRGGDSGDRSLDSGLRRDRSVGRRLRRDRGRDGGLASYDAERVGLLEVGGLGEVIAGRLWLTSVTSPGAKNKDCVQMVDCPPSHGRRRMTYLGESRSSKDGDEEGGAHCGCLGWRLSFSVQRYSLVELTIDGKNNHTRKRRID